MKNSRNLQRQAALATICAIALGSDPLSVANALPRGSADSHRLMPSTLAQNQPAGRTYQIFPGLTFPHFPGTGTAPSTPAKPVLPLVEVPTPGLQPARVNRRRGAVNKQPQTESKPRTRRIRSTTDRPGAAPQPRIRRPRRAIPQT